MDNPETGTTLVVTPKTVKSRAKSSSWNGKWYRHYIVSHPVSVRSMQSTIQTESVQEYQMSGRHSRTTVREWLCRANTKYISHM